MLRQLAAGADQDRRMLQVSGHLDLEVVQLDTGAPDDQDRTAAVSEPGARAPAGDHERLVDHHLADHLPGVELDPIAGLCCGDRAGQVLGQGPRHVRGRTCSR
ncbi:MAG: hypothetical protein E6J90_17920 [Deltaproteobacteria bacterium]|nr:MAG: hypothetical protein E6J90_17920 [Deltaproteobacteria bacterium]TMQ22818.1 MAG: hypothetical protein E6J91_00920 [Deltaproteobacteria bacterium]